MPNPYVNKLVVNGTTKLDLTGCTITAADLRSGVSAVDMSGAPITGTLDVPEVESSKSYSALSNGSFTITPSSGKDAMEEVALTVDVPTGTPRSSSDLTVSGATVTAPAGLYSSAASKSVASGSVTVNTPSINTSTGVVTASASVSAGYVSGTPTSKTLSLSTQAAKTVTPTSSSQTAVAKNKYTTGAVTVAAVPTETKSMTLGASAPSSVTPTSGKFLSSVSPSIDTSVIKAENIAQGVQMLGITGTHQGGSTPTLQSKSVTYTSNGSATVTADSGYDGLSQVTITVSIPAYDGSVS